MVLTGTKTCMIQNEKIEVLVVSLETVTAVIVHWNV